jgi:hypothetical protein
MTPPGTAAVKSALVTSRVLAEPDIRNESDYGGPAYIRRSRPGLMADIEQGHYFI